MASSSATYHGDLYQFSEVRAERTRERSLIIAYLLWFLFGGLGLHRFYLGRTTSGMAQLGLTVFLIPAIFISGYLVAVMAIALSAWLLLDALLIPFME